MRTERLRQLFIALATIVFLAKYFISRGPTVSEEHLVNLSYLELCVISTLFLVEVFFIRRVIDKKMVIAIVGFIFIFIFILIHLYLSINVFSFEYIVKAARLYGYVFIVFIFSLRYFQWTIFKKYFLFFTYTSILFAICSKLFFPEYFSDVGYVFSRPRAFFSEPSAFAPILTFGIYYALRIKSFFLALSSFLCLYFVASGTAYFVVILVGIALTLKFLICGWGRKRTILKGLMAFLLLLTCTFSIIFSSLIDQGLSGSFNYDRSKIAIKSVTQKGVGSSRLVSLFNYYEVLNRDGNLLFGEGLNSATTYFGENSKLYQNREFSILHSFFFSFGFLGVLLLVLLLGIVLLALMRSPLSDIYLFYCCFLFSSLINSSGGHTLYKFIYLFIFLVFFSPAQIGLNFNVHASPKIKSSVPQSS